VTLVGGGGGAGLAIMGEGRGQTGALELLMPVSFLNLLTACLKNLFESGSQVKYSSYDKWDIDGLLIPTKMYECSHHSSCYHSRVSPLRPPTSSYRANRSVHQGSVPPPPQERSQLAPVKKEAVPSSLSRTLSCVGTVKVVTNNERLGNSHF